MTGLSSRRNARSWSYPRHKTFEDQIRRSNTEWFAERNFAVNDKMPYLLARWEDWPKNIILPEVAQYIQTERDRRSNQGEGFPLHKYVHHGLSSQAMLFNLVGPLVVENNLQPLKTAFRNLGIEWPKEKVEAKFEVEDRKVFNEDSGQPTSIDLVIRGDDGQRSLFIEAKLVEHEYGGCSVFNAGDCEGSNPAQDFERCYLHHLGRHYWVLLEKHGFLDGLTGSSPICPLAVYYQFFREVLFAIESGGDFILLFDNRNPAFYSSGSLGDRGLMPFLMTFVPEELKNRIHSISIQQVVTGYQESHDLSWLNEFISKYDLISK